MIEPAPRAPRIKTRLSAVSRLLLAPLLTAGLLLAPQPTTTDAATPTQTNSTPTQKTVASRTIWGSAKPAHTAKVKTATVLGTRFTASTDGVVTAIRYYKSKKNTGTHIGYLWTASGRLLTSVKVTSSKRVGWVEAKLAKAQQINAGSVYVVGYKAPKGHYSYTRSVFAKGKIRSNDALKAVAGVTSKSGFPRKTHSGTAYFVDVRFTPTWTVGASNPTPAPSAPTTTPAPSTPTTAPATSSPVVSGPNGNKNCATKPSACGYPDATNTGPTGTLTKVPSAATSGTGWKWDTNIKAVRTTAANAVLKNLDISGQVVIDHPNALLSNSRVSMCGGSDDNDVVAIRYRSKDASYRGSGAVIDHNELIGTPSGCTHRARSGVRDIYGEAPNATVTANDIYGTGNGITIEYNGTITDNWIHDLGHLSGDHHSGISTHGGALQITVRHNTALLANTPTSGGGGLSAALTIYADFGHAQNTTLQDNLVSGGAYTVFAGNSGDSYDASKPATNIKVLQNRVVCGAWVYGAIAFYKPGTGNELTGNYCDQDLKAVGA
jgi:hypothetical protein